MKKSIGHNEVQEVFNALPETDQAKVIRSTKEFIKKLEAGVSYFEVTIDIYNHVHQPAFFLVNDKTIHLAPEISSSGFVNIVYPKYDCKMKHYINDWFWDGKFVVKGDKKLAEAMVSKLQEMQEE